MRSVRGRVEDGLFSPVRSQTAFEETVERLGTAIKLGLLAPGAKLPAERDLCRQLGIARSTLRQALAALSESGNLRAVRGRGGGTFVADPQPPVEPPPAEQLAGWREVCDARLALEVGVAALAAQRGGEPLVLALDGLAREMEAALAEYPTYRQLDVRFHVELAQSTGSARLLAAMTAAQGEMTDLIAHISHPRTVLRSSNEQHRRLVGAIRAHDVPAAMRTMIDHVHATEHVLGGLLARGLTSAAPRPYSAAAKDGHAHLFS